MSVWLAERGVGIGAERSGAIAPRSRRGQACGVALMGVERAGAGCGGRRPLEVGIGAAASDQLERTAGIERVPLLRAPPARSGDGVRPDERVGVRRIGFGERVGVFVDGAGEGVEAAAAIAEELDRNAIGVDQRDAVASAAQFGERHPERAQSNRAGQFGVQHDKRLALGVSGTLYAVEVAGPGIEPEREAVQIGAGSGGDFDAFAAVDAVVGVVEFVDPHVARARRGQSAFEKRALEERRVVRRTGCDCPEWRRCGRCARSPAQRAPTRGCCPSRPTRRSRRA